MSQYSKNQHQPLGKEGTYPCFYDFYHIATYWSHISFDNPALPHSITKPENFAEQTYSPVFEGFRTTQEHASRPRKYGSEGGFHQEKLIQNAKRKGATRRSAYRRQIISHAACFFHIILRPFIKQY